MAELTEQIPLYRGKGPVRTAFLVSGSATTFAKCVEHRDENYQIYGRNLPYDIAMVVTDNRIDSKAPELCQKNSILLFYNDLAAFCERRGVSIKDRDARREYDFITLKHLMAEGIDLVCLAGWEWYTTSPIWGALSTINSHPGNLTRLDALGRRMFRGLYHVPVEKAILAGEADIRTSIHLVNEKIDDGKVLVLSARQPLILPDGFDAHDPVQLQREAKKHQNLLKEIGDWVAYPFALDAYGLGDFSKDSHGNIYYKGKPTPHLLDTAA